MGIIRQSCEIRQQDQQIQVLLYITAMKWPVCYLQETTRELRLHPEQMEKIKLDEGRSFTVRPTRLRFWHTYEPYGTDTYEVIVKVFDSENKVIGAGNHTSSASTTTWKEVSVDITYTPTSADYVPKAAKIYVFFQSSNAGQGNVPYEKKRKVTLADYGTATTHSGSVLRIDDLSLDYNK